MKEEVTELRNNALDNTVVLFSAIILVANVWLIVHCCSLLAEPRYIIWLANRLCLILFRFSEVYTDLMTECKLLSKSVTVVFGGRIVPHACRTLVSLTKSLLIISLLSFCI